MCMRGRNAFRPRFGSKARSTCGDEGLKAREVECYANRGGNRNQAIAASLFISKRPSRSRQAHLEKLGARERTQAVAIGIGAGSSSSKAAVRPDPSFRRLRPNTTIEGFALPANLLRLPTPPCSGLFSTFGWTPDQR